MAVGPDDSDQLRFAAGVTRDAHVDAVANGSAAALSNLRDIARRAGETGQVSCVESLAAAECYARLAAAVGTTQDRRELVSILLVRAEQLARVNLPHAALRREAAEHLTVLAASDDDLAAAQLNALCYVPALSDTLPAETAANIASTFVSAARGDAEALIGMADAAMAMTLCGHPKFEGLIQAEQYTRLAAQVGNRSAKSALAGVLLLRWSMGDALSDRDHAVEAFGILLQVIDDGDDAVAAMLSVAMCDLPAPDLTYFVRHHPQLLAHCSPGGSA